MHYAPDVFAQISKPIPRQRGPELTDAAPMTATGVVQSMHSYSGLDLYPWSFTSDATPNGRELENIAAHMSAPDAGDNGYSYCQPSNCLYSTDGDLLNWVYGELGAAVYTTELSGTTFFPPASTLDTSWNESKGMLVYLAKIARTPYLLAQDLT